MRHLGKTGSSGNMAHSGLALALGLMLASCAGTSVADSSSAAPASARLAQNVTIDGSRIFPESLSSDAAGNIYVGSNAGTVYRSLAGSDTATPWIAPDDENGLMTVFGVLVDEPRALLWVCTNPNPGAPPVAGAASAIKSFNLADGSLNSSHGFPSDVGLLQCNDMTIADNGDMFATDPTGGQVFFLANGGGDLTLFGKHEEMGAIDGIALAEDGTLYANSVQRQTMFRINRKADGSFDGVTNLELSQPIAGPDGLRLLGGHRFLQAEGTSGKLTYVRIDGDKAAITTLAEGYDYPAAVTPIRTATGMVAFVPEGKITYLFDPSKADQNPDPFIIHAVPFEDTP